MTDAGRKDLSSKIGDSITPNSEKSTIDKISDTVTGAGDKIGRDAVPDSQKSTSQSIQDKMSREKDHHSHTTHTANHPTGETTMDKVKDTLGLNKH